VQHADAVPTQVVGANIEPGHRPVRCRCGGHSCTEPYRTEVHRERCGGHRRRAACAGLGGLGSDRALAVGFQDPELDRLRARGDGRVVARHGPVGRTADVGPAAREEEHGEQHDERDAGPQLAGQVAERIRQKIIRHNFTGGRRLQLSLTASFGVAAFPKHASSPQQLIACADTAMYEAKAANKNCVRFAADLASKEPAKRAAANLENPEYTDIRDNQPASV